MTAFNLTLVMVPIIYMSGLDATLATQAKKWLPTVAEWAIKLGSSLVSWICSGVIGSAAWELVKKLAASRRHSAS